MNRGHTRPLLTLILSSVQTKAMNSISGTLTNPSNPQDVREVQFTKVYGGWRDDSPGSLHYGKILSETTMKVILQSYPELTTC